MSSYSYNRIVDTYSRNVTDMNSNISQMIELMNNMNNNLDRIVENEILFDLRRETRNSRNQNVPRNNYGYSPRQGYTSPRLNTQNRRSEPRRFSFNSPTRRVVPRRFAFNSPLNIPNNLTPVVVAPSQEQIDSATETLRYREIITDTDQLRCPISLHAFTPRDVVIRILHCGHIFSQHSLLTWFRNNVRCPLCRYDIRNYSPLNQINNPYRRQNSNSESEIENNNDNATTSEISNIGINGETSLITSDISNNDNEGVNNFVNEIISNVASQVTDILQNSDMSRNTITAQMEFGYITPQSLINRDNDDNDNNDNDDNDNDDNDNDDNDNDDNDDNDNDDNDNDNDDTTRTNL